MINDSESSKSRVSSLVQICQRVALAHAESISNLGSELRYDLVKPILEMCPTDQLLRLEHSSPHLQTDTPEIWKELCFQKYRLTAVERYSPDDEPQEPDSWKRRYFALQQAEAKRLEEVGSKIRSQRLEADERKKEREVRFTDRVPPPKRSRSGSTPMQPRTLFQKTRTEASKIQKAIYHARIIPPMFTGKTHRVLPASVDHAIFLPLPPSAPTRVTVNTIIQRRILPPPPSSTSSSESSATSSPTSAIAPPYKSGIKHAFTRSRPLDTTKTSSTRITDIPSDATIKGPTAYPVGSQPLKSPAPMKKDPMASLFVPKHRAYSQRPV